MASLPSKLHPLYFDVPEPAIFMCHDGGPLASLVLGCIPVRERTSEERDLQEDERHQRLIAGLRRVYQQGNDTRDRVIQVATTQHQQQQQPTQQQGQEHPHTHDQQRDG
mgnify:CR=1 FL=1